MFSAFFLTLNKSSTIILIHVVIMRTVAAIELHSATVTIRRIFFVHFLLRTATTHAYVAVDVAVCGRMRKNGDWLLAIGRWFFLPGVNSLWMENPHEE
jgi:hypothetical protein